MFDLKQDDITIKKKREKVCLSKTFHLLFTLFTAYRLSPVSGTFNRIWALK